MFNYRPTLYTRMYFHYIGLLLQTNYTPQSKSLKKLLKLFYRIKDQVLVFRTLHNVCRHIVTTVYLIVVGTV